MTDLEEYAVALDLFPSLTEDDRAIIFAAIEAAPEEYPDALNLHEKYFESEAYTSWVEARAVSLSYTGTRWAVNLAEASGYSSIVTKDDILAALHRGKMLVDG